MTTYNGAEFLDAQLASLAAQTVLPSELVVVDDCSSDATVDILQRFAGSAPFPVIVRRNPENVGWRENFFRALALCQGDTIAFCDQDDVWLPEKIETCLTALADPRVLLVYHGAETIDAAGARTGDLGAYQSQAEPVAPPLSLPPWKNVLGFSIIFRAELRRFADYWPLSRDRGALGAREAHDQWFFFLASTFGHVGYVDRELVRYRQHGGNAVGMTTKGGIAARVRAIVPEPVVRPFTAHRQLTKLQDAIAARLRILHAIAAEHPDLSEDIARALAAYARLDEQARARAAIYAARSPWQRLTAAAASARVLRDAPGSWRLPAPPGPRSDLLVSVASSLAPGIARRLTGTRPTIAPAERGQAA